MDSLGESGIMLFAFATVARTFLLKTGITAGVSGPINGFADAHYGFGPLGSLEDNTYVDRDGNTRTVSGFYIDSTGPTVVFSLEGTGIPNTNTTFKHLKFGEGFYQQFQRADATYTADDGNGHTRWTWSSTLVGEDSFYIW